MSMETIKPEYRRVTDIISPYTGLQYVNPALVEAAGYRGTLIHKYIEGYLTGIDFLVMSEHYEPYIVAFQRFRLEHKELFEGSKMTLETRFYDDALMITGAIDLIIETKKGTFLFDWKTSSSPKKYWRLQGAAYTYLARKNGFEKAESVQFVHLRKDGTYMLKNYKTSEKEDFETFKKCIDLYEWFGMEKTHKKVETE